MEMECGMLSFLSLRSELDFIHLRIGKQR
jgi:hypothetical protein